MKRVCCLLLTLAALEARATIVGSGTPAQSLTADRIATLPEAQRALWSEYLARSERQMAADRAALATERIGLRVLPPPPREIEGSRGALPQRDSSWYSSAEARHVADIILSFQTPAGGWSRNLNMTHTPRQRGQTYAPVLLANAPGLDEFDSALDPGWAYVGTLDGDATTSQIRFLARVQDGLSGPAGDRYRAGALHGLHYLLQAQLPNGGWPEVWPLSGGYHDAITFRDNTFLQIAAVLVASGLGQQEFRFVPANLRDESAAAMRHALDCLLAAQVVLNGRRTVWAQQQDALTLAPVAGKSFEPAALSAAESADLLLFLMALPRPSTQVADAIRDGVAWLEKGGEELSLGEVYPSTRALGSLVSQSSSGRLWAHFYSLSTQTPVFSDANRTLYNNFEALSRDLQRNHSWYTGRPESAIEAYRAWSKRSPARSKQGSHGAAGL